MKPIPLLYKRGSNHVLTSTPTDQNAKAILEGAPGWTPREELPAKATFLLDDDGKWFQYRLLKGTDKRPKAFVETWHSKPKKAGLPPQQIRGWVPAETGSAFALLRSAMQDGFNLVPGSTYALVEEGPNDYVLIRHEDAEICEPLAGHPLTFKMLDSAFKEVLPRLGWIGVVWWGPNGETYRLGVSDFR